MILKIMTKILIETEIHATESSLKVKAAILNIFPDATFIKEENTLVAEAQTLEKLKEMFFIQKIRNTARNVLLNSLGEEGLRFSLNKQAAFVGKANFAPPSPMGAINVHITNNDLETVIDFLTEKHDTE